MSVEATTASMLKRKALQGNGSNRRVIIGDFPEYRKERTDLFSIGAMFNNSVAQFQILSGKTLIQTPPSSLRGYDLYLFADGALGWNLNNNFVVGGNYISIATTRKFTDGQWHLAVGTYDGSSNANGLRIYVDGTLEPTFIIRNALSATIQNNAEYIIGDQTQNLAGPFNCQISDTFFYNAQLTAAQVALINGRGLVPFGKQPRLNSPAFIAAMGGLAPVGFWRPANSDLTPLVTDEMGLHNGTAVNIPQAGYVTRK